MPDISKESCDCVYFDGDNPGTKGAFTYRWLNDRRQFPEDVSAVVINMPATWDMVNGELEPTEHGTYYVPISWTVPRWTLTGTKERPTLHPSLNWVDVWHGWLRDGRLESC